jgi:hypothetical protein
MRSVPFFQLVQILQRPISIGLLSAIALLLVTPQAEARQRRTPYTFDLSTPRVKSQMAVPSGVAARAMKPGPGAEPTCYVKMSGRSVQFLDHLCGVNDPKTDRRRSPNELDKDGLPFVMKENYQAVKALQNQLTAAQQRMESEMPFSDNAKQLMAEQKNLLSQYSSAKSETDQRGVQKRMEEISTRLQADPSVRKSYEMMGKLYQQNR